MRIIGFSISSFIQKYGILYFECFWFFKVMIHPANPYKRAKRKETYPYEI